MIRVPATFLFHRLALLVVAFFAVNFSAQRQVVGDDMIPNIRSTETVWAELVQRLSQAPEIAEVQRVLPMSSWQVVQKERSPYLWFNHWLCRITRISPLASLILLSNLFFLWFLLETHQVLTRMVTEHMAGTVGILLVLWPASYELSLGSPFSLTCLLFVRSIRAALDDSWWSSGFSLALLSLCDPVAAGLFCFVLYLFWYLHRGRPLRAQLRTALIFLSVPIAALVWRGTEILNFKAAFAGSALKTLYSVLKQGQVHATFAHSNLGQTITIAFFGLGAVVCLFQAAVGMHKALFLTVFGLWLGCSPYAHLASRAPLSGICLTGLVGTQARLIVQASFCLLSLHEVFATFS